MGEVSRSKLSFEFGFRLAQSTDEILRICHL